MSPGPDEPWPPPDPPPDPGPPPARYPPPGPPVLPPQPAASPYGPPGRRRRPQFGTGVFTSFAFNTVIAIGYLVAAVGGLPPWLTVVLLLAVLAPAVVGVVLSIRQPQTGRGDGMLLGCVLSLVLAPLVLFGMCVQVFQQT